MADYLQHDVPSPAYPVSEELAVVLAQAALAGMNAPFQHKRDVFCRPVENMMVEELFPPATNVNQWWLVVHMRWAPNPCVARDPQARAYVKDTAVMWCQVQVAMMNYYEKLGLYRRAGSTVPRTPTLMVVRRGTWWILSCS